MGVLEQLLSRLDAIERQVAGLAAAASRPPAAYAGPDADLADGVLSVKAAAAFCDLCETEMKKLVRAGAVPSLKHGVRRLVPRRALVRFLAAKLAAQKGV